MKSLRVRLCGRCSICWAMNHDDESKSHVEENCEIKELSVCGYGLRCTEKLSEKSIDLGLEAVIYGFN